MDFEQIMQMLKIEKNKQNLKSIITQIKKSFNYLNKT